MSITRKILEFLDHPRFIKGASVDAFGVPLLGSYTKKVIANAFGKLKENGYIDNCNDDSFAITDCGREYLSEQSDELEMFDFKFPKGAPKDLLISYDIPNPERRKRDWLRYHLRRFDYILVQRSLWVGPSPLPKEFREYLKTISLAGNMKMFRLSKPYKDSTGEVK